MTFSLPLPCRNGCGGHAIARGEGPGLVGEKAPEVSKLSNLIFCFILIIPRDALQGHRRGKNPVAYVFLIPRDAPVGHRLGNNPVETYVFIIPRDAPVGHRRGNNPVEDVFFIFSA